LEIPNLSCGKVEDIYITKNRKDLLFNKFDNFIPFASEIGIILNVMLF
jgi:hypothetical protein